jgi:hypothetical protein
MNNQLRSFTMSIGLTSRRLNRANGDNIVEYISYLTGTVLYKINDPEIVKDRKYAFDRNLFTNVYNVLSDNASYKLQTSATGKKVKPCTRVYRSGARAQRVAAYMLFLPDNAPPLANDLEVLVNSVQSFANGRRTALAEEHIITFPSNYPLDVQKRVVRRLVTEQFVSDGLPVFAAFHKPDSRPTHRNVKSPVTGDEYETKIAYKFDYTHSCKTDHVHLLVIPRKFNAYGSFSRETNFDGLESKANYLEQKRLQRLMFERYLHDLTKDEQYILNSQMSISRSRRRI